MIKTETLNVKGKEVEGIRIANPGGEGHPNMLLIKAEKGFIMCGYLNMDAANKFEDAACIISGSNFEEMLANPVKEVSSAGEKLGITVGMKGEEACALLG